MAEEAFFPTNNLSEVLQERGPMPQVNASTRLRRKDFKALLKPTSLNRVRGERRKRAKEKPAIGMESKYING